MRGRTNINGGGNVVVNGILKELTVAENCTIKKGDFVEVAYIGSKNQFSESVYNFRDIFEVKDGLFIAINDRNIVFFTYKNNALNILSTDDTNRATSLYKLEDNLFLGYKTTSRDTSGNQISGPFTFEVDTENARITNKIMYNIDCNLYDSARMTENHIISYDRSAYGPSVEFRLIDISNHKNITSGGLIRCTIDAKYKQNSPEAKFVGTTDNSVLVVWDYDGGRSVAIIEFTFSEDFTTVTWKSIADYGDTYTSGSSSSGNTYSCTPLKCTSDRISIMGTNYCAYFYQRKYYYKGSVKEKETSLIFRCTGNSLLLSCFDSVPYRIIAISENVWCVIYDEGHYSIMNYNVEEKKMYMSDVYTESLLGTYFSVSYFVKDKKLVIIPNTAPACTFSFTILDQNIVLGEDKNIVKPYNGKQSAIGFAKTGGMAGEKIKVYVPKEIG